MIRAVIFDLDGTLLESESAWRQSAIRLLVHKHIVVPPYIFEALPTKLFREQLKMLLSDPAIDLGMDFDACVAWCLNDLQALYAEHLRLKPGAQEILTRLREAHVKVALATASSEAWVVPALRRLGIYDLFDRRYYGLYEGARLTKADAALYGEIASDLGAAVADCVLVDDAGYALSGAAAAGAAGWAVAEHTRAPEESEIRAVAACYYPDLFALADELLQEVG